MSILGGRSLAGAALMLAASAASAAGGVVDLAAAFQGKQGEFPGFRKGRRFNTLPDPRRRPQAGDKLARKAAEGRIGLGHPR